MDGIKPKTDDVQCKELIELGVRWFCKYCPDHLFTENNLSISCVPKADFLSAVHQAYLEYGINNHVTMDDVQTNFKTCDAAAVRSNAMDQVILTFDAAKGAAPFLLTILHELAHLYWLNKEGLPTDVENSGDAGIEAAGYRFWKEFVADALSFEIFHAGYGKFKLAGNEAKEFIKNALPAIPSGVLTPETSTYSAAARLFGFLMCLDGIDKVVIGKAKLPLPINSRKMLGRELRMAIDYLLELVFNKWKCPAPYTLTHEFLKDVGSQVISVIMYCDDYEYEVGWLS